MKTILSLLITGIIFSSVSFAQDGMDFPKTPKIPKTEGKDDIVLMDITIDSWTESPAGVELNTFRSRGFSLKAFSEKNIAKSSFHFAYGLGLTSHNVHHDGFIAYDSSGTKILPLDPSVDYKVNKLALTYLDIPLELRFRSKPVHKSNRIKVAAGIKGGVLLNSHSKFKDDDGTFKVKKIKEVLPYQYGVTARLGYGKINVSGYYGLSTVFEDGKGPELTPFSIGISFSPY